MAMVRKNIDLAAPLTADQKRMLDAAEKIDYVADEECPELTDEQIEKFTEMISERKKKKVKRVVSLRLSNESYEKAKKFGAGYTGVLSRILETALNHPEILAKCL